MAARRTTTPRAHAADPGTDAAALTPRHAALLAAAVYAVATLILAYPLLGGQFLVNPSSDQYIAGYAFRAFGAQSIAAGQGIPLWNPYIFGGVPYVAGMAGDIFYPTALLRMLVPTDVAMSLAFVLHIFLAGIATYGFLRAYGLGFFPSLLGGLAYMLSGNIASFVSPGHDGKLYVSALLPVVLLLLVLGIREGRRWAWGVLALVIGLAVVSPHPQLLQYMLLASGSFALFLAYDSQLSRAVALRRLGLALLAVVLGAAMGAVQWLPVAQYAPFSPRAGGIAGYAAATSYSLPPEELLDFILPQFTGILDSYWGRNGIHLHSEYLGAVVLILAGAAIGTRRRRFGWFWLGALVVALLWALGGFTPFYRLVYAVVPGTKFFRAPSTILYLISFSTAVLAAIGTERLLARPCRTRYVGGWLAAGVALALLASVGFFTALANAVALPGREDLVQANSGAVIAGAWRTLLFVVIGAAVLIALARGKVGAAAAGWLLVAAVTADLWSIDRIYWQFSPPASVIYAADPTVTYLQRQTEPGRVLAIPLAQEMVPRDPTLTGDALMVNRIRTVLGYHGNQLARYDQLAGRASGYQNVLTPQFWRLMNVRYLLTNTQVPQLQQVVGPVKDAAGTTVYLYRLPGENPAAWLAPAIVKAPDDATLGTVLDPRFDPRRAAIFDTASAVAGVELAALPDTLAIPVTVSRYEPGRISVRLAAPAPAGSALLVAENYYPGWRATSNGKELPVARADYTLIGVALPVGARAVDLEFTAPSYERGKTISLVAVAAGALLALGGALVGRRAGG